MASYSLSLQVNGSYLQNTFYLGNLSSAYNVQAIAIKGNNVVFANNANAFQGEQIIYSTNQGTTWLLNASNAFPNNANSFYSVSVSSDGKYIFACGIQGAFLSVNFGVSYYLVQNPSGWSSYSYGVTGAMSSDGSIIAMAEIGNTTSNWNRIWFSNNFGASWYQVFGSGNYVHDTYFIGNGNNGVNMSNSGLLLSDNGKIVVVTNTNVVAISINSGYSWSLYGGTTTNNSVINQSIRSVAMTNDGSSIVVSTINAGVFLSTDYGTTCSRILIRNTGAVGISGNGRVILVNDWNNGSINNSTNGGVTWNNQFYTDTPVDIKLNSDGSTAWLASGGNVNVWKFGTLPPTVILNASIAVPVNGTYTAVARTKSVSVRVDSNDLRSVTSVTGNNALVEDLNTIKINMSDGVSYNVYVMVLRNCFKEDTKILCYVDNEEKYIPVQDMKKGTLVKTSMNGYIPVHSIGHAKIFNPANKLRGLNRLYKCTKAMYPEITEDLVITGCHSILMDIEKLTPELKEKTKELTGREELTTDTKWRLMAVLDERAEPFEEEGTFTIWHFALDHFDEFMNYGVYANGLLVESCDINMMREHSGLEMV